MSFLCHFLLAGGCNTSLFLGSSRFKVDVIRKFSIHFAETLWVLVGEEVPIDDVFLGGCWDLDCVAVGAFLSVTVTAPGQHGVLSGLVE